MKTKFFIECCPFIVYTDKSKNADFVNNGFFAETEDDAYELARGLISLFYGDSFASDPDWYVSDGNYDSHYVDPSCVYMD